MAKKSKEQSFALCIENKECEDLEKRKIYKVLPDDEAAKEGYLRIVDESGEDYLYPESYFILVELPRKAQDALQVAR
jgi:hypothetical protein